MIEIAPTAVYRSALAVTFGLFAPTRAEVGAAADPWDTEPAVQEVLELRRQGTAAITSAAGATAESERYSSTFVANTPGNAVVTGQHDLVVLMGEEGVVPGPHARAAGKRIHRRFTDVFRRENGEWRHDLRHANVISVE